MAKKKDYNIFEVNGKTYIVAECVREDSNVREIPYTISEYVREVDDGEICRDPLTQRTNDQWTKKQKSKLIESVLHNRPIGNISLAKGRAESKSYAITSLIDGLQRTTALVDFRHDNLILDKKAKSILCKLVDDEGNEIKEQYDIAGKKYSQLPDAIKKFFDKYRLTTYLHEGFSDEELDDVVFCMNNGKAPNAYQKMRFLLGSDNMRMLQPICDSTLWEDVKGCMAKNDSILCCVVRILMMLTHYPCNNLGAGAMAKFVDESYEELVTTETIKRLKSLIEQFVEIKYTLNDEELENLNSITVPHYIVGLESLNNLNKSNDMNAVDVLRVFWSSDYFKSFTAACESNGSGGSLYSLKNVEDRQYAIYDFLDNYFGICDYDEEQEIQETQQRTA